MKTLSVSIKTFGQFVDDFEKRVNEMKTGKIKKSHYGISFSNDKELKRFFQNIDVLMAIMKRKPKSLYELATIMQKDIANVSRVVDFYERIRAIKTKKAIVNGRATKVPIADYDDIRLVA